MPLRARKRRQCRGSREAAAGASLGGELAAARGLLDSDLVGGDNLGAMKISRFRYNFRYSFNPRKPRLQWRIARAYLDLFSGRRHPLRYVDVNVGLACNLRCEHCFAENFHHRAAKELSNEEWASVISQAKDLGAIALGFTGGEPLAYSRLYDLIRLARPEEMLIIVCTNGTLLTPKKARELRHVGVDIVQMSVDSGDAEEHDRFRGREGAFEKTREAFRIAREAGLKVAAVPTVSHQNLHTEGFRRLIDWAEQEDILVNLSMAAPVGEWADNRDCLLTPEDLAELNRLVSTKAHVRRDFETNYWKQGCGAAIEKLYVTPFGDVIPCPYMHISFGNVREAPLAAIRQKMCSNSYLKGFHPRCLTAEDEEFIDKHLPRQYLKGGALPRSEEIFGEGKP
ncbi:Antilisterial bacteriocin subtilosin biosynthesis protein AlbA [Myxococcaceae bacterium]|nr:Antilisterial bacteriocin subtilosin biosynthesis protein AlbA [Myxococcaceae bacterium]